jgi:hypothetical protein
VKGEFELKDVHCEVRTHFPTKHLNENLRNIISSTACHFISSAPNSTLISRHIHYTEIHIEFKINLWRLPLLFKNSHVIKNVSYVNGTKFCCCSRQ